VGELSLFDQTLVSKKVFILDFSWSRTFRGSNSHNLLSELHEQSTLIRLCHEITNHVPGGTPLDRHVLLVDAIGDKIIQNIDMLRAFATQSFSVLLDENGTLVVLWDSNTLCF
jgi:hypothetical protein